MVSVAFPVLLRVTFWAALTVPTAWLPNVRLFVDRLAMGATPTPLMEIDCVLPAVPLLLSVIVTDPVLVPTRVGVKVMEIVQLRLDPRELPQLLVSA
jgi:hypothetical protein